MISGKDGFTLLEIMIAVAVIGLLAVVATPNLKRARYKAWESKCVNNLRIIWAAKDQYAFENICNDNTEPTEDDISIYMKNNEVPTCPYDGDHYDIQPLKQFPKCPNDWEPGCEGHVSVPRDKP